MIRSRFKKVITVLVGHSEDDYTVHKDLICAQSPFFRAACNGNFVEAAEGTVRLPDDEPETFELLLQWLYMGRVGDPKATKPLSWHESAYLYVIAEKLQISELKNAVVDSWITKSAETCEIPIGVVAYVYCNTPDSSHLRRLLVDMVACAGSTNSLCKRKDDLPHEFLLDLSMALIELRHDNARAEALYKHNRSLYHEHSVTDLGQEADADE